MTFSVRESTKRLVAVGCCPSLAQQLSEEILQWSNSSGEEWTVKRLKMLRHDYLRHLAGLEPVSTWIGHHSDGRPKGPFGALWKFQPKDLFRCWNALMCYTSFVFQRSKKNLRMTRSQLLKLLKSVRRQPPPDQVVNEGYQLIERGLLEVDLVGVSPFVATTGSPLKDFNPSPQRRAPASFGQKPEIEATLDSLKCLALRERFTDRYWEILSGSCKGLEDYLDGLSQMITKDARNADRPLVGALSFIQEPGYKLRYVANPYRVWQVALKPLGQYLFELLRRFPSDSTYDQEKGVSYCQSRVKLGKRAWCFDLSSATDNFPLSLQLKMLDLLGIPELWINFFAEVSHGDWNVHSWELPKLSMETIRSEGIDLVSPLKGVERLSWSVGQPLGLYPSFACFALCHHLVVLGLFNKFNREPDYALLGDDIVIFDDDVAQAYRSFMTRLGVAISDEKTISSDRLAEFAGRVILPTMILRGYKWRGHNDNSFIDVANNLGERSLFLFRRRQRRVLKIIGYVPSPWGLGWNPKGLPYWERLEPWLDALSKEDVPTRKYQTKTSRFNHLLYNSDWRFVTQNGFSNSYASDQDAREFLQDHLGPIGFLDPVVILPNLDSSLQENSTLDMLASFSLDAHKVSHLLSEFSSLEKVALRTTLVRFEKRLGLSDK